MFLFKSIFSNFINNNNPLLPIHPIEGKGPTLYESAVQKKGDGADMKKGCVEECLCLPHCV